MHRDDENQTEESPAFAPGHPPADQPATAVPSGSADQPERPSFADPLPARSHALDPSVPDSEESKEQAPPSPEWLREGTSGERVGG